MALGTRSKFQFEIITINVISRIVYFREIILESSRNVSETTPRYSDIIIATTGQGFCGHSNVLIAPELSALESVLMIVLP